MPTRIQRPTCLLVALALVVAGCQTSVKEHDAAGQRPQVTVRASWKDSTGKRLHVGGLQVQLVRKGGGESQLVASAVSKADGPLVLPDLAPGRYRLIARGAGLEKTSEEFELAAGKRVTVRVRIEGTLGPRLGDALGKAGQGVLYVLGGAITVALAVGLLALLVVASIEDSDERDE